MLTTLGPLAPVHHEPWREGCRQHFGHWPRYTMNPGGEGGREGGEGRGRRVGRRGREGEYKDKPEGSICDSVVMASQLIV